MAIFDFVFDQENNPLVVEVSYDYTVLGYDSCLGYWVEQLKWYEGKFNHEGWMVDMITKY